ncbi:ATP-binding cassette domain-containing protein [Rhodococcus zopfii]|uniref:ATP-binding cassette domain-containing protein n=1 Tax=Rhodococcus zopfii TaxID=43772 RepID=UPI00352868E9
MCSFCRRLPTEGLSLLPVEHENAVAAHRGQFAHRGVRQQRHERVPVGAEHVHQEDGGRVGPHDLFGVGSQADGFTPVPGGDDRQVRVRRGDLLGIHGPVSCHGFRLDTGVGERGAELSGGQRQRLALTRASLHDGQAVIVDEGTSPVDERTENRVLERLQPSGWTAPSCG